MRYASVGLGRWLRGEQAKRWHSCSCCCCCCTHARTHVVRVHFWVQCGERHAYCIEIRLVPPPRLNGSGQGVAADAATVRSLVDGRPSSVPPCKGRDYHELRRRRDAMQCKVRQADRQASNGRPCTAATLGGQRALSSITRSPTSGERTGRHPRDCWYDGHPSAKVLNRLRSGCPTLGNHPPTHPFF